MAKRDFRRCSGRRVTGTKLPCRFRASIEYEDKWYCKKCYKVVAGDRAHQPRLPPTVKGELSLRDLQQLSDELKEYRMNGIDSSSAKTLVLETMPLLLNEVLETRGAKS